MRRHRRSCRQPPAVWRSSAEAEESLGDETVGCFSLPSRFGESGGAAGHRVRGCRKARLPLLVGPAQLGRRHDPPRRSVRSRRHPRRGCSPRSRHPRAHNPRDTRRQRSRPHRHHTSRDRARRARRLPGENRCSNPRARARATTSPSAHHRRIGPVGRQLVVERERDPIGRVRLRWQTTVGPRQIVVARAAGRAEVGADPTRRAGRHDDER